MDSDSEIIQLLTEIRDNQQRQLEAHQKSQREYVEFYNAALAMQHRRALIASIVIGVVFGLMALGLLMK